MKISRKSWQKYIDKLNKLDTKAARSLAEFFRENPLEAAEDTGKLLDLAYALATYYGEGAAELACEMYDAVGMTAKRVIPPAEPAPTPTYGEVAKAVQGTMLQTKNPDAVGASVGRLVKRTGLDTVMNNALRDGAEFAWIPSGDTCAFCQMLASDGWQRASKKALKNGHASHVHSNCDCTYAVRFDDSTEVEGYDPEYYQAMYDSAEGDSWEEKLNSMRRANYAANSEKYRVDKRLNYAARTGALDSGAYNDENDPLFKKRDKIAEDLYYQIEHRKREFEISAVARNSGFSIEEIDLVFEHIFEREHLFEDGTLRKFDPSYYMAHSWLRLREGKNIQRHDIILLHHELEEAKIMKNNLAIPYEKAHNEVEKVWNYRKALMDYLKDHEA